MAEAYGKLTGRPGICMVTRGPGATQAAVGVHTAFQDSTPLILLVGQVASTQEEREAFQEVDFRRMFGPLAQVGGADRPGRPDPGAGRPRVHDGLRRPPRPGRARAARGHARRVERGAGRAAVPRRAAEPERGRHRGAHARCSPQRSGPLAILGGGGWSRAAATDLQAFLEANALPAGAAFRRQDSIDNDSPSYVGDVGIGINPALAARVRDADVLLVVGPRLGEMTTSGYTLLDVPQPRQTLVHVHPGAEELGRVYQAGAADPFRDGAVRAPRCATCGVEPRWRDWARGRA